MSDLVLFAALECDEAMRREALILQQELRKKTEGSYPPADNFHVTLFYFGKVNAARLGVIQDVFSQHPFPCGELSFSKLAAFAGKKGDTIQYQAKEQEELSAYRAELARHFESERITFDGKAFVPHVTLVRAKMKNVPISDIMVPRMVMRFDHAVLFESVQENKRRIYRPVWISKRAD